MVQAHAFPSTFTLTSIVHSHLTNLTHLYNQARLNVHDQLTHLAHTLCSAYVHVHDHAFGSSFKLMPTKGGGGNNGQAFYTQIDRLAICCFACTYNEITKRILDQLEPNEDHDPLNYFRD